MIKLTITAVAIVISFMSATAVNFELAMPSIPEDMPRAERPDYVVTRFWDGLDSMDMSLTRDREFMEINAVNFFYLLPYATSDGRNEALRKFFNRLSADTLALKLFQELAEQYMADPASPLHNEDCYIAIMRQLVNIPDFRMRAEFQINMLSKNRLGTVAADFNFVTRDGLETTLAAAINKPTLLLLYDIECAHCIEVIESLRNDNILAEKIGNGSLDVLAVCIEGNHEQWATFDATLPAEWISGFDLSDIIGNDIYFIQTMPVLFLLDSTRTILRKNILTLPSEIL